MQQPHSGPAFKHVDNRNGIDKADPVDLKAAKERIVNLEMQLEALSFHLESLESEIANNESVKAGVINDIQSQKDRVEMELDKERRKNETLIKQVNSMEGFVKEVEELRKGGKVVNSVIKPSTGVKNARLVQELTTKVNTLSSKLETCQKRLNMALKGEKRVEGENKELKAVVTRLEKQVESKSSPVSNVSAVVPKELGQSKNIDDLNNVRSEIRKLELAKTSLANENQDLSLQMEKLHTQMKEKDTEIKTWSTSQNSLQAQISQYEKEREMLIRSLEEFEKETNVVIASVEKVTAERDSLKSLYKQVNSELDKLRQHKSTEDTTSSPLVLQIDKLRQENHELKESEKTLLVQVEALKSDLNAILTRQRENGSLANEAVSALDVELADLKKALQKSCDDQVAKDNKIAELEDEIKSVKVQNRDTLAKCQVDERKAMQLQLEVDKLKLEIRDSKNTKLSVEERIEELQRINVALEKQIKDLKIDSGNTRQFLDEIDKERDQFQADLDSKTEKLAELQDLLTTAQRKHKASEEIAASLKDQVEALTTHLSNSDKECSKLSRELAEALTSCQHWEAQAKQYHIEGQRLSSDLMALTRENQILNGELSETASTRDKYRAELTELELQLNSLNEFVKSKDDEKNELMSNYRKLIADHERLDVAFRGNLEELNHLRMEVVSRDKKLISLERQLDSVTREATQFQIDNNAHSKQSSNLSRALATSERQIKQLEVDKQRLSREVQACRELAHSVDRNKDSLQAQFVQLNLERDRLVHSLEKSANEKHAMEAQLKSAMLKADQLEQLLTSERTKKMETERSSIDIKHSRAEMEMKLKELSENQEIALNSTKRQLKDARKELNAAAGRISHLEAVLAEKDRGLIVLILDLSKTMTDLENNNAEIARLKDRIQTELNTTQSLIKIYGDKQPNAVELRLLGEISNTQRERQYAETQLESAMMPSYSNASIASKETVGNNDQSPFSRRLETVLDTIVQVLIVLILG